MRFACIVLAYKQPAQLALLLSMLRHPDVNLYLHVDKRQPVGPFRDALVRAGLNGAVLELPRHPSRWGSAECVDAALEGINAGLRDGVDYFVLLSGQDFPVWPVDDIVGFFDRNREQSYLEHWPIDECTHRYRGRDRTDFWTYTIGDRRETCVPFGEDASYLSVKGKMLNTALRMWSLPRGTRRFPAYVEPYAGTTWWNLTREAAEYVLRFMDEHPDYRTYHQHTRIPEEIFFSSILAGADYDGEVVNDSLRYFRWDQGLHPSTLTERDIPAMIKSDKLFARKFDIGVNSAVLHRLAERAGMAV